jgi:hypothetical protein
LQGETGVGDDEGPSVLDDEHSPRLFSRIGALMWVSFSVVDSAYARTERERSAARAAPQRCQQATRYSKTDWPSGSDDPESVTIASPSDPAEEPESRARRTRSRMSSRRRVASSFSSASSSCSPPSQTTESLDVLALSRCASSQYRCIANAP